MDGNNNLQDRFRSLKDNAKQGIKPPFAPASNGYSRSIPPAGNWESGPSVPLPPPSFPPTQHYYGGGGVNHNNTGTGIPRGFVGEPPPDPYAGYYPPPVPSTTHYAGPKDFTPGSDQGATPPEAPTGNGDESKLKKSTERLEKCKKAMPFIIGLLVLVVFGIIALVLYKKFKKANQNKKGRNKGANDHGSNGIKKTMGAASHSLNPPDDSASLTIPPGLEEELRRKASSSGRGGSGLILVPPPSKHVSSPGASAPDVLSPDVLSPDVLSPDVLSPDVLSPDVSSPGVCQGSSCALPSLRRRQQPHPDELQYPSAQRREEESENYQGGGNWEQNKSVQQRIYEGKKDAILDPSLSHPQHQQQQQHQEPSYNNPHHQPPSTLPPPTVLKSGRPHPSSAAYPSHSPPSPKTQPPVPQHPNDRRPSMIPSDASWSSPATQPPNQVLIPDNYTPSSDSGGGSGGDPNFVPLN